MIIVGGTVLVTALTIVTAGLGAVLTGSLVAEAFAAGVIATATGEALVVGGTAILFSAITAIPLTVLTVAFEEAARACNAYEEDHHEVIPVRQDLIESYKHFPNQKNLKNQKSFAEIWCEGHECKDSKYLPTIKMKFKEFEVYNHCTFLNEKAVYLTGDYDSIFK